MNQRPTERRFYVQATLRVASGLLLFLGAFGVSSVSAQVAASGDAQLTSAEPIAEDMSEARYQFRQGELSYNSAHFAEAAGHFEEAHRLSGRDEMYYNIFLAHRDGANLAGAVAALALYLDSGASAQMAPQRERLEGTLAAMRRTLEEGEQEASAPEAVAPNEGTSTDPAADIVVDLGTSADDGVSPRTIVGASLLGVAAAGAVLGIVMQLKQNNEASRLDDECQLGSNGDRCPAALDQQAIADDHSRFGTLRWVGFGIGAAALAGGLTLLLLPESNDSDRAQLNVSADPSGVRIGLHGIF